MCIEKPSKIRNNNSIIFPPSIYRKARKTLTIVDLRRAARKPWRHLQNFKGTPPQLSASVPTPIPTTPSELQVVILD